MSKQKRLKQVSGKERGDPPETGVQQVEKEPATVEEKQEFIDRYIVIEPFGMAAITRGPEGKLRYFVVEPELDEREIRELGRLKMILLEEAVLPLEKLKERAFVEGFLRIHIKKTIKNHKLKIPDDRLEEFFYYIMRDFLGYGVLDVFMKDPNIEDISCDGEAIPLYVWHKFYENLQTSVSLTKEELNSVILRLAYRTGYQVTVSNPILDGDLPDGSRAHIALGEVSKRGGSFTIRKFSEKPFTVVDLINFGTMSAEVAAYFWIMIENFRSMMISGATASGKTTLLNAIAMFIFPESKICTIEETREIRLPHENWVPLVSRQVFHEGIKEITLFDLLKSSLRQRPDYIVVGEVRGQEAYTFFQAIGTGHGGLCTIHSDSIETSVKRLLTKPMDVPLMLMGLMQVGVHISRVRVGGETTRRVVEIKETIGIDEETEKVEFNPTFNWGGADNDSFLFSGRSIVFERMAEQNFIPVENYYGELEDRAELLRWMALKKRMTYNEIAETIRRFYYDKDGVMQEVRLGED